MYVARLRLIDALIADMPDITALSPPVKRA
jgi:hypothetical protein